MSSNCNYPYNLDCKKCSPCGYDTQPDDPRDATTLDEAAKNLDGTYNGARALSWLSGLPLDEMMETWNEVKQRGNVR